MKDSIMQDNRTFYIYSIKNKLNGKEYIGQTTQDPKERFRQHKNLAGRYYDFRRSYIHRAIGKYGVDSFDFCVIDVCIGYVAADELEKQYIKNRKTLKPAGYNLKPGGNGCVPQSRELCSVPITFDGITYPSISAAARSHGMSFSKFSNYILGKTREQKITFSIDGFEFSSLAEAAKFFGCSTCKIKYILEGKPRLEKPVVIDGVTYKSKKEATKALGVSKPTVDKLAAGKKKWVPEEFTINGVTYPSRSAARKALGVHDTTIKKMLAQGREKLPCTREVTVLGVTYATLAEAKRVTGFSESKINRLASGGKEIDRRLTIDGVEYRHKTDAMEKLGLTLRQVNRALAVGTIKAASSVISVRIGDVTYKSVHDAMQSTGMSRDTIYRKCADGENIEFYRDLTTEESSDTSSNPKE